MMKESVVLLEEQLQSARVGDTRRRELERRVASLQAELIAKDRALQSQYQQGWLWPVYIHREEEKGTTFSFMNKFFNMPCHLTKFCTLIANEYCHRCYLLKFWNLH